MSESLSHQRQTLVKLLRQAAELEQNLLLAYLYSTFSLKSTPDQSCSDAEWEVVRRWYSQLLMVARQEMEHLSLVQSLLLAIGEPPYFGRANLSGVRAEGEQGTSSLEPVQFPIGLVPYSRETIQEYVCIESPSLESLREFGVPIPPWCFEEGERECFHARMKSFLEAGPAGEAGAGTIEELYEQIAEHIKALGDAIFVGSPAAQPAIQSEYNIFIPMVDDATSALAAVDLITKQGEGSTASHTFRSHFHMFLEMEREFGFMLQRNTGFKPVLPWETVSSSSEIEDAVAKELFEICNEAYVAVVFMLAGYYNRFDSNSGFSQSLQMSAFAPMMTMVFRPLLELLAGRPINDSGCRTGPSFHLSPEQQAAVAEPAKAGDVINSLEANIARVEALRSRVKKLLGMPGLTEAERMLVNYLHENTYRLSNNLPQIATQGILPNLNPES